MELVEGPTLADRIKAGPIPVDEAVLIARQIAEGLEYAHERGIVPSVERGKSNIADCPCIPPQGSSASHGRKANPRTPCTYSPASARDLPEGLRSENLHENLISHP
jgi:serine/threonine protein kinase